MGFHIKYQNIMHYSFIGTVPVGLYCTTQINYLLFHSLVEIFSIVVAFSFFLITWNSKIYIKNQYILFIGIAYLFIAFLDLVYAIIFKELDATNKSLRNEIKARINSERQREKLIDELRTALADVNTLSGLLPICAKCKKIRDDKGYWNQIESYIRDHSGEKFSHGSCPDCAKELYSEFIRNN